MLGLVFNFSDPTDISDWKISSIVHLMFPFYIQKEAFLVFDLLDCVDHKATNKDRYDSLLIQAIFGCSLESQRHTMYKDKILPKFP